LTKMKKCTAIWPLLALLLSAMTACGPNDSNKTEAAVSDVMPNKEAREDSLEMAKALQAQALIALSVTPDMETQPIQANNMDDAADDPAIWVHPTTPEKSLILGSNKRGGIAVYNLEGKELAYYPVGNMNNVDVLSGVVLDGRKVDLAGGSNRSRQSIDLFVINPDSSTLSPIGVRPFLTDTTLMDDVYGFCFYRNEATGRNYLFVNAKNGRVEQHEIVALKGGNLDLKLVRTIPFETQVEGMVADFELGHLYVGEEGRGVWKLSAQPDGGNAKKLIAGTSESNNPNIRYDVEGLDLYYAAKGGYLIVSSQGNFSYAVYDRMGDNRYLLSFKIVPNKTIDGVEETDGLALSHHALGKNYPSGIMVVQDGFNTQNDETIPQNFKLINWEKIKQMLDNALKN
jgi:3-phytase